MANKCIEGKILNPKTGRCVKIDGRIGKSILKKVKSRSKTLKEFTGLAYFENTIYDLSDGYEIDEKEYKKFSKKIETEGKKCGIKNISYQMGADEPKEMFLDFVVKSYSKKDVTKWLKNVGSKRIRILDEM